MAIYFHLFFLPFIVSMSRTLLIIGLLTMFCHAAFGQKDTVITSSGIQLYGNIKSLHHGTLVMSADFADGDVKVKWKKVERIYIGKNRRIFRTNGERYVGTLADANDSSNMVYIKFGNDSVKVKYNRIVEIQELKDTFRKRLKLGINFGYGQTKANNSRHITIRANIGYTADHWELSGNINSFATAIDTLVTSRGELKLSFRRYLLNDWFAIVELNSLSSDQQQLESRVTGSLGVGNDLIRNQRMELFMSTGVTYNDETYFEESVLDHAYTTYELFGGLDYTLFDVQDIDINTSLTALPSLTEMGRFRANYDIDMKWDITKSINLKAGYTLNFDSKPPNDNRKNDYVFSLTFGWSLK